MTTATSSAATAGEAPFHIGDTVTGSVFSTIFVSNYSQPVQQNNDSLQPGAGLEYATVTVKVCAGPTPPDFGPGDSVSPKDFELAMPEGNIVLSSILDLPVKDPALVDTTLRPNQCVLGVIPFVVPKGQHAKAVVYGDYRFGVPGSGLEWLVP